LFIFVFFKMEIPIPTVHLFPALDQKLITLLRSLTPEEWNYSTLAKQWTVKDIASHLLDGNLRMLSIVRDGFFGNTPKGLNTYRDVVDFLNGLNADWVIASKRLSPRVIVSLLEQTGGECHEVLLNLDPFATAVFSVAWAGETESKNWFHIAREYTERWHHQQQIREAVGREGIMDRKFYFPLIDTFMRALPHTYRNVAAKHDTHVIIRVTTEAGGAWSLLRANNVWKLSPSEIPPAAEITLDPSTAWKLFTKGISADEARAKIQFGGDEFLCKPILSMLSVMA
jgi:uncharacterized protein (TIGR03083 family)